MFPFSESTTFSERCSFRTAVGRRRIVGALQIRSCVFKLIDTEIRRHVGADSLGYLSLEGLIAATGATRGDLCTACFTGDYLVPVQLELTKDVLEASRT